MRERALGKDAFFRERIARDAVALISAFILSCTLFPAAAFAGTCSNAGASSQASNAQPLALTTQSSAVTKSAKKTTKKSAAFKIKRYGETKKYKYATGKWAYGKPVLKGSTKIVKRINASLNKRFKEAFPLGWGEKVFEGAKEASSVKLNREVHDTYKTKCTYNAKGYISFRYEWSRYMGASHFGCFGDVYSLKTGKKLNVSQVVSGNAARVKRKIANAFAADCGIEIRRPGTWDDQDEWTWHDPYITIYTRVAAKKISDFDFYLQDGNVVVVLPPDVTNALLGFQTVTLKGNYA